MPTSPSLSSGNSGRTMLSYGGGLPQSLRQLHPPLGTPPPGKNTHTGAVSRQRRPLCRRTPGDPWHTAERLGARRRVRDSARAVRCGWLVRRAKPSRQRGRVERFDAPNTQTRKPMSTRRRRSGGAQPAADWRRWRWWG